MSDWEVFGRTAEQTVDVQVPEIREDAVGKMILLALGEQIQVSTMGFIDGPWSQATEDITGVAKRISEGELRNRTVEQPVASFMPVKTIWFIPQERVFDRNAERVIDVSVPQILQLEHRTSARKRRRFRRTDCGQVAHHYITRGN